MSLESIIKKSVLYIGLIAATVMPYLSNPAFAQEPPTSNDVKKLEYRVKAKDEEKRLKILIEPSTNKGCNVVETRLEYHKFSVHIDELFRSIVDTQTCSTIYFSIERNNSIFGNKDKLSRKSEFDSEKMQIRTFADNTTTNYDIGITNLNDFLKDSRGQYVIVDPMSAYYFLTKIKPEDLDKKKVICSDGNNIWIYNFSATNKDKGYRIIANSNKKNTAFSCYIENGTIKEIDYKILFIKMNMKLVQ